MYMWLVEYMTLMELYWHFLLVCCTCDSYCRWRRSVVAPIVTSYVCRTLLTLLAAWLNSSLCWLSGLLDWTVHCVDSFGCLAEQFIVLTFWAAWFDSSLCWFSRLVDWTLHCVDSCLIEQFIVLIVWAAWLNSSLCWLYWLLDWTVPCVDCLGCSTEQFIELSVSTAWFNTRVTATQ